MALALYRKYRPRTFAEVIGQEHVTEPLIQALKSGRLNHAYLFSGPRGCGKTSSARILARSLNCAQGPTPTPCGECESCRALAPDGPGSIDVIEIDAASHGGVDDARELRERAFFTPAISRYKIYIIDEAHMVSSAGFNALLKLVEEPPEYVKFVFATTEPEKVLGTIKSRTHHYPFRLIPPGVLRPYLEQLAAAEGVKVDPQVFPLVVRAGGGSARDSLSVLDQLISGSGADGVAYSRAVALLGVTDVALIDEMVDAIAAVDGAAAFGAVDKVAEAGHDARRFAGDLLERLRDLIVLRQVPEAAASGLISAPEDELARMRDQASRLGAATLSRCADILHNGLVEMRGATSPRLLLELLVARMLLPATDDSTAALLQRLERVERGVSAVSPNSTAAAPVQPAQERAASPTPAPSVPVAPQATQERSAPASAPVSAPIARPVAAPQPEPARVTSAPAAAPPMSAPPVSAQPMSAVAPPPSAPPASSGGIDAVAVRRSWDEIVRMVSQSSKKAAAFAREAVVRDIDGDTVVLVFKHKVHAGGVDNDPTPLTEALRQVLGGTWRVRCEVGGDQRAAAAPARSAPPKPQAAPQKAPTTSDNDWPTTAAVGGVAPTPAPRSAVQTARSAPMVDEEPPYDPEFDGPIKSAATIEGFDPGDEPTDEVIDEAGARLTSEQRALDTLKLSFDVEKLN